ncbi:MAG: chemotaxis protein CheW [Chloroherpetonaceae bacterium]|nr:chemotaxis protein CheW [Chloroherpetonaceae bacterium]MCS7211430.1 chemotaxis protein CheW [Chloroherpetonaceae bacterium]MDW8020437.1 chemotaxis protein CheW [Chloroherpetonaceae bacterium]
MSIGSFASSLPASSEVVIAEIGNRFFGFETASIKSIVELPPDDPRLLIEPYLGSFSYQDGKIPLLQLADFFSLPSPKRNGKVYVLVMSYPDSPLFGVLVCKVLGKLRAQTICPLPQEAFQYAYLYKYAFEFNGSYLLLIDAYQALHYVTEYIHSLGNL